MTFEPKAAATLSQKPALLWLPRLLLAAMFVESAIDKLLHWPAYVAEAAAHDIPLAPIALAIATIVEIAGSAALISGAFLIPALLALAVYTVSVNLFYFDFWTMAEPASIMARKEFLKNLAVAGGLLSWLGLALRMRYTEVGA